MRNPWSASLNVGSLRRMARLSIDASTGPPLLRDRPASVRVTSESRSVSSAGATTSVSGSASAGASADLVLRPLPRFVARLAGFFVSTPSSRS